jgi:hypothetical protein
MTTMASDDLAAGATEELARLQRKNRCVRQNCPDMSNPNCRCMQEWQAWLNARRAKA